MLCPQHPEATAFVGARLTMEEQWGSMVEWARVVRSDLSATGAEDLQDWALVNRGYMWLAQPSPTCIPYSQMPLCARGSCYCSHFTEWKTDFWQVTKYVHRDPRPAGGCLVCHPSQLFSAFWSFSSGLPHIDTEAPAPNAPPASWTLNKSPHCSECRPTLNPTGPWCYLVT